MDPINAQKQIKDNAQELQDFVKELESWQEEMKLKDEALRGKKSTTNDNADPEIMTKVSESVTGSGRKCVSNTKTNIEKKFKTNHRTKIGMKKKDNKTASKQEKKLRSTDYSAWEKFDVERACEEVISSSEEDEHSSEDELHRKLQAVAEKDKGNNYFKCGKYDEAISCYTNGISFDPFNAILPANRAMALIKKQQFGAAEVDCNSALQLDPAYIKAYQRRATARFSLGKLEEALADHQEVLRMEPWNKHAKLEIEKIEVLLKDKREVEEKKKKKVTFVPDNLLLNNCSEISSMCKDVLVQSQNPLKRLHISESDIEDANVSPEDYISRLLTVQHKHPNKTPSLIEELGNTVVETRSTVDTQKHESIKVPKIRGKDTEPVPKENSSETLSFGTPKTFIQFRLDWKRMSSNTEMKYQYLKQIKPDDYAKIFQNSLESDLLSELLSVLQSSFLQLAPTEVRHHLRGISRVPRFTTIAFFMSYEDRAVVRNLLEKSGSSDPSSSEEISELQKIYQI